MLVYISKLPYLVDIIFYGCDQRWRNDPLRCIYVNVSYRTRAAGTIGFAPAAIYSLAFTREGVKYPRFFFSSIARRVQESTSCRVVFLFVSRSRDFYIDVVYFVCATWIAKWSSHVRHRTDRGLHDDIRRDRVPTIAQRKRGCTYIGSEITRCRNAGPHVYTPVHVELWTELQALVSLEGG